MGVTVVCLVAPGIGALLSAVPALRALARRFPAGEGGSGVWVVAEDEIRDLTRLVPGIRGAAVAEHLIPQLAHSASVAVNLHGSGPESHLALLEGHPSALLAFQCPGVWSFGPRWVEDEDERVRWCRLLWWARIPADPARVRIHAPDVFPRASGVVVLHLAPASGGQRWSPERFAEVARGLTRERVVLTGTGAADRECADAIRALAPSVTTSLVDRLSVLDLAALISAAKLVLCTDTGVSQLATAYGIPSVTVFGPSSVRRWGPPADARHRVLRAPTSEPFPDAVPAASALQQASDALVLGRRW